MTQRPAENVNEEDQPQFEGQCQAEIEIFKVEDQEKHCVLFSRIGGSKMVFYDQVRRYIEALD